MSEDAIAHAAAPKLGLRSPADVRRDAKNGDPDYRSLVRHYERCLAEHGDTHRGVDWPDADGARLRYDVMLDLVRATRGESRPGTTLLDFGCGTGALRDRMHETGRDDVEWIGLDLSPAFVDAASAKWPDATVLCLDVLDEPDAVPAVDYVVCNGVFHERLTLGWDEMWEFTTSALRALWARTRVGLAVSLMSKHVDWEREDLFHVPFDTMAAFLCGELSRHLVFRSDYGKYEYTVYVYREPAPRMEPNGQP